MNYPQNSSVKIYLGVVAVLGWFAVTTQFYININSNAASLPEIITRFFSYFTILTNLIVTICSTSLLLFPASAAGLFFSNAKILTAITVYILIVGIIYNLILRFIWNPQGLQMVVDELLHSVIPLLFLGFWALFVKKDPLAWKDVWPWLIYPLLYTGFIFIRGYGSGFYPYPFIDAGKLSLRELLLNTAGITLAFLAVSLLLIGTGKLLNKKALQNRPI